MNQSQWKPNVTVAAIIEQDGKYLCVEEYSNDRLVYNQPAGHLEANETLIEAVKREVLEETAWDFTPDAVTGIYLYPNPKRKLTYLRVCFVGQCTQHHPELELDEGIVGTKWLSREELLMNKEKLRSPMVIQCIDDYLAGQNYSLDILNHYIEQI